MSDTRQRILKAVERLGPTEVERARRIGFTVRTLDNWYAGEGLRTVERLVEAGVLRIVEVPDDHPADPAAVR